MKKLKIFLKQLTLAIPIEKGRHSFTYNSNTDKVELTVFYNDKLYPFTIQDTDTLEEDNTNDIDEIIKQIWLS